MQKIRVQKLDKLEIKSNLIFIEKIFLQLKCSANAAFTDFHGLIAKTIIINLNAGLHSIRNNWSSV